MKSFAQRRIALVAASLAVAALVAGTAWLVLADRHAPTARAGPLGAAATIGPVAITATALGRLSKSLQEPIFWAGARRGETYELTQTAKGYVYVRYLPHGVAVGDPRSDFLVVATYPFADGYRALEAVAGTKGTTLPDGTLAFASPKKPRSVYLARRGLKAQIEVFDPVPSRARQLALSGRIQPVG